MKKRWGLCVVLAMMILCLSQFTVSAAGAKLTISNCVISGQNVTVIASGKVAQSDTGLYYLFELKPYEAGIGSRADFCASAPAAAAVQFATPLNFNQASSKLYSRFVVAAYRGGTFVPVSNEMYITNPEALATKSTGYPVKSKKGLTADSRYLSDFSALGAGFAAYELDISRFFTGGGVNYTYNGKTYSFNSGVVTEYDILCRGLEKQGCNVVMTIKNTFNPATLDLILPAARGAGQNCYAMNVNEQAGAEKVAALLSFLANRYSGTGNGTIHTWIIGNEINNNSPWHFAGAIDQAAFTAQYAKEFRHCYNAIKSQNAGARVYVNIDQRWMHTDRNPYAYPGRDVLDGFAAITSQMGNIDWGLSIHPHPVPLFNCQFWNLPPEYASMKLISHADNSKMVTPLNLDVVTNHMMQPTMLSPNGTPRHILISEMSLTSSNAQIPTNQQIQAAAMVYAYKLAVAQPLIEGIIIHRQVDAVSEIINSGMAVGIRTETGAPKVSYEVFKYMDTANTTLSDSLLPYLGATSWSQLGVK